ncbi:aminopeptidase P family protein [Pedobacter frigiditerrae]|uniref:Aminopeptidase P family protein n=1 Tax=Pedobacter frigiditerrae TaxID=2530452 RepID=A0A4R0MU46_9SPHI|nr:aminopeptidase P family protein [Pedobacter frigiditerrae]TCC90343.1 aminopeptidase P family protein [Pedobacter frigiditerrae]
MTNPEKLNAIREQMKADGVAAYIIPSADPHISEYLPSHYKCIPFVTGFTGSVSTVVITQDFAGLWADARYFEQAEEQLEGSGFELVKLKVQHSPEYIQWLSETLTPGATIAFDEKLVSVALGELLHKQLAYQRTQFKHKDYLSPIWENRPALPAQPAFLIADEHIGQSVADKLTAVRNAMKQHNAKYHLVSSLDDMAWLFNMRGADVSYNPVVLSFALISETEATLYIQSDKLTADDKANLAKSGVSVLGYDTIAKDLQFLPAESSILIDPRRNCFALYKLIPTSVQKILETNPSTHLKAVKNNVEVNNTRQAMIKDGVAITQFIKWVKENIGQVEITEISAAAQLREFRAAQDGFIGESFNTIAAYKAHGALPHYGATEKSNVAIEAEGLFLVDSGGQYRYGTTDITRVIPMGNNTEEEKTDYTLVLKAMIEGCKTRFPKGTCGYQIDAITRRPMWDYALNYGHGTGHGVGYFLNVHEGPQVFNATATAVPVELGMITSIEPGIYRPGKHGIRIENLVLTIADQTNDFNEFYAFESLTLAPIDTTLVKKELLEQSHIAWLNQYHANVYAKLSPFLNEEEKAFLGMMTSQL